MPVYKILEEMPYDELVKWGLYFEARPSGWREDDRTAKLLMAFGVNKKPHELFQSLAKMKENEEKAKATMKPGQISFNNLRGSAFFSKMLGASGGDELPFLKES